MSHLQQVKLDRPLQDYPRLPLTVIEDTDDDEKIDFFSKYGNFAVDLLVDNLDTTNTLKLYLNGESIGKTIAADTPYTLNNVVVEIIRLIGTTGTRNWEVQAFVVLRDLLVKRAG